MPLEQRMFHILGLREVHGAVRVTPGHPLFEKKEGMIWIPFRGGSIEAHECVQYGLRLRTNRDRMTFYLNGLKRCNDGGPRAVENADYMFRMDGKMLLEAGFEMWLDQNEASRGEIYTHGVRLFQLACVDLWVIGLSTPSVVWSLRDLKHKSHWHKMYGEQIRYARRQT